MKEIVLVIFAVVLGFAVLVAAVNYQLGNELVFFGFDKEPGNVSPVLRTMLLFVTMVIGVVAGQLFRDLPKTTRITWDRVKKALGKGSFIGTLLGAPIVFGLVYSAARDQPDLVLASTFSFQNGFVCHNILSSLIGEKGRAPD